MKIGILCYPTYGGSGVVATELGIELAARGHQVHFISYSMPMRLNMGFSDNISFHKVEMASYPLFDFPLYSIALASKIVEVAKFNGLDLVHAHYAIPHATSAYLAREIIKEEVLSKKKNNRNIKIITTLHGTDITLTGLEISFLPTMKFSVQKSDGVTAVSEFLKTKTQSQYEITKDIKVIPNFINQDIYKKIDNTETKCLKEKLSKNGEKILVHTSNFRPLKRVDDAIKAFKIVNDKIPSKLLLIGDGPERSKCEYLVKDLGLVDNVKFYGEQESFTEILSVSDLFLMPSQYEPCGLNQMYSLNYGTVPIVKKTGGLADTVLDFHEYNEKGNGFTFKDHTSFALFSAIERALTIFNDKKIWKEIMMRGMKEDFSWKHSAKEYMRLYRKAKDSEDL